MFKGWIEGLGNKISALWGNNTTVNPLPPNQNIVETEVSEEFIDISVPTGDLTRKEHRAQERLARRAERAARQQAREAQRTLEREQRALQREAQRQQRAEKARRTLPQTPTHAWQETPTDPEMAALEADLAAYAHENDISLSPQQVQAGEEFLDTNAWLNELPPEERAIVQGAQEDADKINRVAERAAMPMFGQQAWTEEELLAELDAFSLSEEPEALEQKSVTRKPAETRQPKKRKLPPTPAGW